MLGGPCRSAREPCVWSGLGPLGVRSFARSAASFSSSSSVEPWRRWMCSAGMPALRATRCRRDSRWSSSSCLVASVACFCARLEFGEVAVLEVLEALLEGLPLPPFLREVGEDGVLVALAGLRVALVALARLRGSWRLPGWCPRAPSRRRRAWWWCPARTWVGSPSRSGCPARISRAGAGGPRGVRSDSRGLGGGLQSLGAVGREALDGAHGEPLTALQPLPGDATSRDAFGGGHALVGAGAVGVDDLVEVGAVTDRGFLGLRQAPDLS
jgi:hypothetical protein